ncbi:hypothetical protein [Paenibacillus sp. NPDC058177]|uniref:hypothetical protein n=1 Tax=Paenibacillus sp. NPDC058177 TaxID=3346369 RepID=UPI0036DCA1C1
MVQKNGTKDNVSTLEMMNFRPAVSRHTSRPVSKKSVLSVVNHKNGARLAIDVQVIEDIGTPGSVQVALNDEGIAIGEGFTDEYNYFPLMKAANKAIIYSSPLVNEITKSFNLDFSNVSSISFHNVEYLEVGSDTVAFIKMVHNEATSIDTPSIILSSNADNDEEELDLSSHSDDDNVDDDELDLGSHSDDDNDEDEPQNLPLSNQRRRKRSA